MGRLLPFQKLRSSLTSSESLREKELNEEQLEQFNRYFRLQYLRLLTEHHERRRGEHHYTCEKEGRD